MTFVSGLFIKLVCHVSTLLNTVAELIAASQIAQTAHTALFRRFLKPLDRLSIVIHVIVVEDPERIHR
jgi:hypothetical protein